MADYVCRGADQLELVAGVIACLSPAKAWRVVITPYQQKRSGEQNDRWQAITREIAKETGDSHESVKHDLKIKFGFFTEFERDGVIYRELKSTSKAGVGEMSELMDQVEAFAIAELGLRLG